MKRNLLSIFALGLSLGSFAQITYTDINDVTLTASTTRERYEVDLNDDNTIDFVIFALDTAEQAPFGPVPINAAGIELNGNNEVAGRQETTGAGSFLAVNALSAGNDINSTSDFTSGNSSNIVQGGGLGLSTSFGDAGDFIDAGDKYIAVKFEVGVSMPTTHYGWIRVSVAEDAETVTIKDFAYEATANTELRAGDAGNGFTSVIEKELNDATIFFADNELNIQGVNGVYSVAVVDLLGKSIYNNTVINTASINLNAANNGIYLVQVKKRDATITKKVYVK